MAIARSRGILHRKRIDDALPLLANLALASTTREVAARALADRARPARRAGPADAWWIAEAALHDPELADAAAIDRLVLRARFVGPDRGGELRPRRAPFIGVARLNDGRWVRAIKGIGALATIRLQQGR